MLDMYTSIYNCICSNVCSCKSILLTTDINKTNIKY